MNSSRRTLGHAALLGAFVPLLLLHVACTSTPPPSKQLEAAGIESYGDLEDAQDDYLWTQKQPSDTPFATQVDDSPFLHAQPQNAPVREPKQQPRRLRKASKKSGRRP